MYFSANVDKNNKDVDQSDPNFVEGNLKHSINGALFQLLAVR